MIFIIIYIGIFIVGCGALAYEFWNDRRFLEFILMISLILFLTSFIKMSWRIQNDNDCPAGHVKTKQIELDKSTLYFEKDVCYFIK